MQLTAAVPEHAAFHFDPREYSDRAFGIGRAVLVYLTYYGHGCGNRIERWLAPGGPGGAISVELVPDKFCREFERDQGMWIALRDVDQARYLTRPSCGLQ